MASMSAQATSDRLNNRCIRLSDAESSVNDQARLAEPA
jgi:hypothetical protein